MKVQVCAAGLMIIAGGLSHVGIVNLIAAGYGTLAWAYFMVFIIPLFTIGLYKLRKAPSYPNNTVTKE